MKKLWKMLLVVLCFSLIFTLPVSAAKKKKVPKKTKTQQEISNITKATNNFIKNVKNYNVNGIKKCFSKPGSVKLMSKRKLMAKYIRSKQKKLSATVANVTYTGGKTAKVTLNYHMFDGYDPLWYSLYYTYTWIELRAYDGKKTSSSAMDKHQYSELKSMEQGIEDVFVPKWTDGTVSFTMKKVGKKWKISSFTKQLDNFINCNYQKAYKDWYNEDHRNDGCYEYDPDNYDGYYEFIENYFGYYDY
jgi:hypothetical protein